MYTQISPEQGRVSSSNYSLFYVIMINHNSMKKFKALSTQEMSKIHGGEDVGPGETFMGAGYENGRHYIIVDTGTACVKRYQPCAFEH